MTFWNSLAGVVEVELTSADPADALRSINETEVPVFHVRYLSDLTCSFQVNRNDIPVLERLARKKGETLRICRRIGLFWYIQSLLHRPVLAAGFLLFCILVGFLPTRVLFIRVDGNEAISSNQIISSAEECGIRFFASRRDVRSEKVKNALLGAVPQLQWAGINTYGCVAVISVRERTATESKNETTGVSSIVAAKDGIIESCTAIRGNMLCNIGQAVKKGEILISGYTDCGICIQATHAEGEIYAQTRQNLDVITLSQYVSYGEAIDVKHKYSFLIGKKRINLWKDSGIWDTTCGRMYEEYYITLPGGFRLPVALVKESFTFYDSGISTLDMETAAIGLKQFSTKYLNDRMIAGKILSSSMNVYASDGIYRLEGTYLCSEMIGRVQHEKMGE